MVDGSRLREELKRMRELIASDPSVKARFDKDGNGVIDGAEWEEVRQLVIQRLEREELGLAAATAERSAQRSAQSSAQGSAETAAQTAPEDMPVVVGSVAERIYREDLPAPTGASSTTVNITDCHDLIVEERGLAPLLAGLVRRNFGILSADGRELGEIRQREHEWAQQMTAPAFSLPDLHFDVADKTTGETYTFRRSQELLDQNIVMMDGSGAQVGYVEETFGVLKPTYSVVATFQGSRLKVKWHLWHPLSLSILDAMDDRVGEIERGWAGLGGFLTGANRIRIKTDPQTFEPSFRFGVIAAAVLAEMSQETRDKRGSLLGMLRD